MSRLPLGAPQIPVVANVTATAMLTVDDVRQELAHHVERPVNWTRSVAEMVNSGATTFIEVGPGQVLSGLIRRINRDVTTLSLTDLGLPADVARQLILRSLAIVKTLREGEIVKRVVVTGLGAVSPLGIGVPALWEGLVAGRSGVRRVQHFDTENLPVKIAAEVPDFDPKAFMDPKSVRRMDRFAHFAIAGTREALADAKLEISDENRDRVAVVMNTGGGGIPTIESNVTAMAVHGPSRVGPLVIPDVRPEYGEQSGLDRLWHPGTDDHLRGRLRLRCAGVRRCGPPAASRRGGRRP